ncbi:IS200/IS605 family transposase [Bifidobacterium boum]|uniref:IS200/IS605 family transposase n=1 Tax=Bifidobacterium TaxID=1678 RepID=UPI003994C08F
MELQHNSHQVYELGYHIIFCTKYRNKVLEGDVAVTCRHAIAEACVAYGWKLEEIEVMPDHVHMFVTAPPQTAPAEIAKTVKSISAVKIFTTYPSLKGRRFWGSGLWSPSTYFGSVGHISEDTVRRYIQTQKERA